jgi:4-hydroxybenzoate polyprenyltransferase
MAKMQRWRRGRFAGEDTIDAAEAEVGAELSPEADDVAAPPTVTEAPATDATDGADEAPEVVDEAVDEAVDDPDEADEADDEVDDPNDRSYVPLPHVPERTGLTGWLFGGKAPADTLVVQLIQAAHAKQAITTALAMGVIAAVTGRPAREAGVVLLTVLVGQTMLGWHNDIVDRQRDQAHGLTGKPVAMGRLEVGTLWYAIAVAFLLVVPLSWTTGIRAGCLYLAALAVGMLGNVLLRTGFFSWWSWAASYALLPAYLSYGGWGGQAEGSAPEPAIVALAAALGVGIHFMRAVWGLVADHEDGWTYLPLKVGMKIGATRLLALSTVYVAGVVIALVVVGTQVGLSR